jgi:hypothetical protein
VHNLLRCCRGSVAFGTVAALVPLLGFVALGAEAGSWYVNQQQAQNAADGAAMSGALAVVNESPTLVNTRGQEFGTLDGFSSSNVTMASGTFCPGTGFQTSGSCVGGVSAVRAVVTRCLPQTLSKLLYTGSCNGTSGNVTVRVQAVASVNPLKHLPCVLATNGPITFQDASVNVNAPNCGLASNGSPIGIDFKVAPKQLVVGSLTTSGGCSGSPCTGTATSPPVTTYAGTVKDPFVALQSAMTTPSNLTISTICGASLTPYEPTSQCVNQNISINSAQPITQSGIYFFSGTGNTPALKLTATGSLYTCTVGAVGCSGVTQNVSATIILLPSTKGLDLAGGSSISITAPTIAPSASPSCTPASNPYCVPSQLSSVTNLLTDMAIFDSETSPKITGNSTMSGTGVFYLPNATPLNWSGTSTGNVSTCTEVIASSINLSGTPNLDNSGCPPSIILTSQIVALVQ